MHSWRNIYYHKPVFLYDWGTESRQSSKRDLRDHETEKVIKWQGDNSHIQLFEVWHTKFNSTLFIPHRWLHYLSPPQLTLSYHSPSRPQSISWNTHGNYVHVYWEMPRHTILHSYLQYQHNFWTQIHTNKSPTFFGFPLLFLWTCATNLAIFLLPGGARDSCILTIDSSLCSPIFDIFLHWKIGCNIVILCFPEVYN